VSLFGVSRQPVILAFYPADWSLVCSDQMSLYNEVLPEFRRHGAELIGISVDGRGVMPPLRMHASCTFRCSPTSSLKEPSRARTASIARPTVSTERALFVIDAEGVISWSYVSPVGVNPGAEGILAALEALHPEESKP